MMDATMINTENRLPLWDTFTSRLVITAQLRADTALRIGAGGDESAQPTASDLPVLTDAEDRPYIPGSSLRGVLRSHIERVVRTLEGSQHGACYPTGDDSQWCVPNSVMNGADGNGGWRSTARTRNLEGQDGDRWLAEQIWDGSCRVCRVFGNTWLASRVRIADLHWSSEGQPPIERRDGVAIDRDKETVQHKYDFETVARHSTFSLRILAENLTPSERGLLWLGLNELSDGHILVGGFKGRGLGRVALDGLQVEQVDGTKRDELRQYLIQRKMQPVPSVAVERWLDAFWEEVGGAD